jgi:hypothetical protein
MSSLWSVKLIPVILFWEWVLEKYCIEAEKDCYHTWERNKPKFDLGQATPHILVLHFSTHLDLITFSSSSSSLSSSSFLC